MKDSKTAIETWALTIESAKSDKCRVTTITIFDCVCIGVFQFKNEPMRYQLMADTKTRYIGRTGIAVRNRWQHPWVNHRDYVRAKAEETDVMGAPFEWYSSSPQSENELVLTAKYPPESFGLSDCRLTHFITERYAMPARECTGEFE